MNKIRGLIRISRPVNLLIAFLSVVIAAAVTGTIQPLERVILAAIAATLITIGANVINDYFDQAIDTINKPHRPIPAGIVSPSEALILSLAAFFAAWILAWSLGFAMFSVALIIGLLLIVYSWWLKRTIILGNLTVSIATATAFVFGGMAVGRPSETIFPASFAFLFHFGREILKDLEDVAGDQVNNAITFAVKFGRKASLTLVSFTFILLLVWTLIPYIVHAYGHFYLLIILLGVYPVIIYVLYTSWKYPDPAKLGYLSNLLKADMLVGLLAIYFG
jgi:geranylgeranylglycerol-phosphate geranylgeranyltransferase